MKVVIIGYFTEASKMIISNEFPEDWKIDIVAPEKSDLSLENADVVIPEHIRVDSEFLSKANKIKFVQTGAGFDNVDIEACTRKGIWVSNAAGVNAIAVAEHVMAFILSWYKNIPYLDNYMKEKKDEKKLSYGGSEIADKTIGIIGVGAVGQKVAKYCNAFGMKVLGYVRRKIDTVENIEFVDLDTLYMKSDIVTVHVSLNDKTRHMINSDAFKKMKKSAIIINTARGAIIDEKALIAALKNGDIAGAGLDVFEKEPLAIDSELREFDNVILTPHTAGMPDGLKFHKKRYAFFIENIKKVIAGKKPDSALNKI
ncbi:MAG: phosphoglycerate dehydrogenase [Elusimicrobiota bacterium]|jgi:D-3-phosphoglycerate dehydrogenase|nr:phosphoglycerate dehydrogenase [Elusimicrobiota bacterium]